MNIDLNTQVTVTLTKAGNRIVRVANLEYRKQMAGFGIEASNVYKIEGDQLTDTLWEIIQLFAPHCSIGMEVPFTDLRAKDQASSDTLIPDPELLATVPTQVREAARLVEYWMKSQGHTRWALYGLQSRGIHSQDFHPDYR